MAIQFEQVTYTYPSGGHVVQTGLDQLELDLPLGKFTAILGASGSGKSTLLQHLNGILKPAEGELHILDTSFGSDSREEDWHKLRRQIGLVFQFPEQQLFEDTVLKEMCFGLRNFGMTEFEAHKAAYVAAEHLGLSTELMTSNPFELSSGQMRKVAIASVLAMAPSIIALDEPTASLDQESRHELLSLLHTLCHEHGQTVIVVSHRLEEVFAYADHYVYMDKGQVFFQGDAHQLVQQAYELEKAGLKLPPVVQLWAMLSEKYDGQLPSTIRTMADMVTFITRQIDRAT